MDHYPSTASLPPSAYIELERYLSALRAMFAASGKELVAFERHLALRNKVCAPRAAPRPGLLCMSE